MSCVMGNYLLLVPIGGHDEIELIHMLDSRGAKKPLKSLAMLSELYVSTTLSIIARVTRWVGSFTIYAKTLRCGVVPQHRSPPEPLLLSFTTVDLTHHFLPSSTSTLATFAILANIYNDPLHLIGESVRRLSLTA